MIPAEPTSVQKIWFAGTGGPTFRCQIMVPFTASSAYTLFEFGCNNDHWARLDRPRCKAAACKTLPTIAPSKFKSRVRFAAADCVKAESM